MAVVAIVNSGSSRNPQAMNLMRCSNIHGGFPRVPDQGHAHSRGT